MTDQERLTRFPLCWPDGWKRTQSHERKYGQFGRARQNGEAGYTSKVRLSVVGGFERVLEELGRIGISENDVVVSTNVRTRLDGAPRSNEAEPSDPGVAVYWEKRGKRQCMAIDRYVRVADNLAAIAATLEAMRAIERHGGAEILDRAFTGFVALPAPEQWFQVLGVSAGASVGQINDAFRALAAKHHPDRGGDGDLMARINAARDEGLRART